jgi:hypothetical protein
MAVPIRHITPKVGESYTTSVDATCAPAPWQSGGGGAGGGYGAAMGSVPGRVVILVDDLRSFVDGRSAEVARTSAEGIAVLERHREQRIDELWLDHDLGGDDTIWPVVELLELAAFEGRPFDIGVVLVHSANPPGGAKMLQALRRWGYAVRGAAGSSQVGYLGK